MSRSFLVEFRWRGEKVNREKTNLEVSLHYNRLLLDLFFLCPAAQLPFSLFSQEIRQIGGFFDGRDLLDKKNVWIYYNVSFKISYRLFFQQRKKKQERKSSLKRESKENVSGEVRNGDIFCLYLVPPRKVHKGSLRVGFGFLRLDGLGSEVCVVRSELEGKSEDFPLHRIRRLENGSTHSLPERERESGLHSGDHHLRSRNRQVGQRGAGIRGTFTSWGEQCRVHKQ